MIKNVLLVDDVSSRDRSTQALEQLGCAVSVASSSVAALAQLGAREFDAILMDVQLAGSGGSDLPGSAKGRHPRSLIVLMVDETSDAPLSQPLRLSGYPLLTKPLKIEDLARVLASRSDETMPSTPAPATAEPGSGVLGFAGLMGDSVKLKKVYRLISKVALQRHPALVVGESGTGKELVARAIHQASPRRYHPLVVIHCGALTETLLESELFGHEKGAFTGAQYRKKGKFEIAEGGTVFLDEIGDISLKTQTDLLRVLQEREITRVGGNQIVKVDFRCIAATNKDLEKLIEEGKFRPDLFYRLNVFRIELPPLRSRRDDIPALVDHFVRKFSLAMNKRISRVTPAAMNLLQQQPWLGNVRELENAVERAMVVGQEPELREQDFIFKPQSVSNGSSKTLEDMERAHILRVLEECGGNQSRAAEILDIDRVTLYHKLKKYGWTRTPVETH